jgi:hypothetical protein
MPTNHLYPGLPHAPASANLPRKPYSQSASLEKSTEHGSTSTNTNNDLRLNSFAEKPGQFSTARPTTPVFPQLSSTTQDILARVQGGRSTPATSGPPKSLLRDTKSVTGLLKSSVISGSENTASPSPSTSKNPAPGPILSVVQHTSNPNARQTTSGGSIANSDQYRKMLNHPAKAQTLTSFRVTSQISVGPQSDSTESTIQVGSAYPQTPTAPTSTSINPAPPSSLSSSLSSRRQRSYVLSDGTVVSSGKGLGRGRPGIKRGPRKPKLDQISSTASTTNTPAPSPLPGKKRKHSTPKEDEERVKTPASSTDDDDDDNEEEDSDNYTPKTTHTRSGRSTQKPQSFVSADSPAAKKPRLATEPPNPQIKNSLIKKKIYRGREQNALCEYCLRGRGPANNAIVFCDGCNLCWHQNCHDPRIPKELVLDKTAEWFCKDCVAKLKSTATEAKDTNTQQIDATVRAVPNAAKAMATNAKQPVLLSNTTVTNAAAPSGLPGRSLDLHKRQQYFSSLSKQALIDLLLQVYSLAPELPVFHAAGQINAPAPPPQTVPPSAPYAPPAKANPAPTLTPTITPTPPPTVTARPTTTATPSTMKPPPLPLPSLNTSPNPNLNPSRAAKAAAPKYTSPSSPSSESTEDSESEEEYQEEEDYGPSHSKVYPKPGQGVMAMLPPDSEDEHMLLEGAESRTFSHSLKGRGPLVVALG